MQTKPEGFGTFRGVYVPNMVAMFGVIMYLRLGFAAAHVGVTGIATIVGLSLVIMTITGLSITSIVTNMRVGGGGAYFILSRSLGIEIGAALGFSIYACQIISISMCTAGFALSFNGVFPQYPVVGIELVLSLLMLTIAFVSSDFTLKTQTVIFGIILASLLAVFTGSMEHVKPVESAAAHSSLGFWAAFSIFFPAMTGIEAGMALSGTLKNPSRSLAIGTLAALASAGLTYLILALFLLYEIPAEVLITNPLAVQEFASLKQLIILGIWGATISSALGCVLGAPRILQAMAGDGVLPDILARTYGKRQEPRYALVLTSSIGLTVVLTTEIDQIIPLLTMICLISYGMLNFVAGFADLIQHPSWRPKFKTPWYLCFIGSVACLTVMLMVNSGATIIAFVLVVGIYLWVRRKNISVPFEDLRDTIIFYVSRKALYRLSPTLIKPKNWHLNLLALAPSPFSKVDFVHFVGALTKRSGLLTFASIVPESWGGEYRLESSEKTLNDFFSKQRVPCVVEVNANDDLHDGCRTLLRSYGIGHLQPNTIALCCPGTDANIANLLPIVREAAGARKNVIIFRGEKTAGTHAGAFTRQLKKQRSIDIWWDGDDNSSFSLLLFLANNIRTTSVWKGAGMTLRAAVKDEAIKANVQNNLQEFLASRRIDAQVDVQIVLAGSNAIHELTQRCEQTTLVLMGIRPYPEGEASPSYDTYLLDLIDATSSLRNMAYVMACGDVAYKEIFAD